MATEDVLISFMCPGRGTLDYTHALPAALCDMDNITDAAAYQQLFTDTLQLIMAAHHQACFVRVGGPWAECFGEGCGKMATRVLTTPLSYLHKRPPSVRVAVSPVCGDGACEREVRAEFAQMLAEVVEEVARERAGAASSPPQEVFPCGLCGNVNGTRKCSGCGVVAYCNAEHQHAHWKVHKKMCKRK